MKKETKKISSLDYTTSGFGIIIEAVKVDMKNHSKKIYINDNYTKKPSFNSIEQIEEKEFVSYEMNDIKSVEKDIQSTNVANWKDKYVDEQIMDGCQWSLNIKYEDGGIKHIYGSNKTPRKYEKLRKILLDGAD